MKNLFWTLFALILLAGISCQDKQTTAELNELKSREKLEENNKELVSNYFNELCKTKPDDLAVFLTKFISLDYILHLPGEEIRGMEGLVDHYASSMKNFPNFEQPIYDIIADGNKVAFRGEFIATQSNGNVIKSTFSGFWQIKDGKIVEWWSEYDALGMMQQLGMELKPVENKK
ncbi:ester cyclase [Mariniphaga sp.]|uniref:ester cyclase n=1 Tax=Mariniphaga sp. TaxID=1954475 RepID=UPI0035644BB4